MVRPSFPTDISRTEFEQVRGHLDKAHKRTRPRTYDPYDVICAILYLLGNKLAWRRLPDTFPPWRSVHHHFIQWTSSQESETPLETALGELALHEFCSAVRLLINARADPPA